MSNKSLSIIIPIYDTTQRLTSVLQSCLQLEPSEIIFVINGCIDVSVEIARSYGCRILTYDKLVDYNVSHAIGQKKPKEITCYF